MSNVKEDVIDIAEEIDMMASAQDVDVVKENFDDHMSEDEKEKKAMNDVNDERYTLILSKEYIFENKKINKIDFSKLPELTTRDLEYADRVMARVQHAPNDKFSDTLWNKMIAIRATGYSIDFFNSLSSRDMLAVVGTVRRYFLLGWE